MFLKGRKEGTIIVGGGTEKWFAMEPLAVAVSDKPPDFWWLLPILNPQIEALPARANHAHRNLMPPNAWRKRQSILAANRGTNLIVVANRRGIQYQMLVALFDSDAGG